MKPFADFLEQRNALILALRDHDLLLKSKRRKPGDDRAALVAMLTDMGVQVWEYGEEPWVR